MGRRGERDRKVTSQTFVRISRMPGAKHVNCLIELICKAGEKELRFLKYCSNIDGLKVSQDNRGVQTMTSNGFERMEYVVDDVTSLR